MQNFKVIVKNKLDPKAVTIKWFDTESEAREWHDTKYLDEDLFEKEFHDLTQKAAKFKVKIKNINNPNDRLDAIIDYLNYRWNADL